MKSLNPWIITALLTATLFASLLAITGCSEQDQPSPQDAVKNTLAALEDAAEARTLEGFMRHIAKDYQDHEGMTWDDVQRIVQFEYLRNQSIHVLTDITKLEINGNIAAVELNAAMASRAQDLELLNGGIRADTHHFSVILKGTEDLQTWQVQSVSWQRGWK